MSDEKRKLEQQIAEAKRKLQELEDLEKNTERNLAIKNLDEYTIEEKIEKFDAMYNSALEELTEKEKEGWNSEDSSQYAWESYIELLARNSDKFWKYWNNL